MSHSLSAQVVQRGLMLEYNEELAKSPLGGVEVVVRGAPSSVSDASGGFELEFLTQSGGERVSVTRIEKPGYEIFNKEALEQWNINPEEPFRIVMCESGRFKRIRDNYSRVSSESYARQQASEESRLRELLEDGALKEEEYRKELYELKVEYQTKLDDLESYVDRFARIDLSELDEVEREIIRLVQAGDMEGAIARYEAQDLVGKYRAETEDIREIETARESLDEMEQAKREGRDSLFAAVRRQFETYVLAGGEENYEKAGNLLREVALADTTNLEAVWEYAAFAQAQHDYDSAEKFYLICLNNIIFKDNGLYYPIFALVENNLGTLYSSLGRYSEAERYLLSSLVKNYVLYSEQGDYVVYDASIALALANIGMLYNKMNKYSEAETYLLEAIDIYYILYQRNSNEYLLDLIRTLCNLSSVYLAMDNYDKSMSCLKQAEHLSESIEDNCNISFLEEKAYVQYHLANLYLNLEQQDDAEKYYLEAERLYNLLLENNPKSYQERLLMVQNGLGLLYTHSAQFAKAEHYLLLAEETLLNLMEINNEAYLEMYAIIENNIGSLYSEEDVFSFDKAQSAFSKALYAMESLSVLFPDIYQESIASCHNNLGMLYSQSGQYQKAEKHLLESLHNRVIFYKKHPEVGIYKVAMCQNNLGYLYFRNEDYPKSLRYFVEAENNFNELNKDYPDLYSSYLAMIQLNIGDLAYVLNDDDLSESSYLKSAKNFFRVFQTGNYEHVSDWAHVLSSLASLYCEQEKFNMAENYYLKALKILQMPIDDNPNSYRCQYAETLDAVAEMYYDSERYSEAVECSLQALAIYESLSIDAPESFCEQILGSKADLGWSYMATGQFEMSKYYFEDALSDYAGIDKTESRKFDTEILSITTGLDILARRLKK